MAKKIKSKKKKLTPAEKEQRRIQRKFHSEFRTIFRELDFARVNADGIEITVGGRKGELDDIFIFENIIVLAEYTVGKADSSHILKKKPLFDNIQKDIPGFLQIARQMFPELKKHLKPIYADAHYQLRIIYASLHDPAPATTATCPDIHFIDSGLRKYFYALSRTIQKSASIEFFSYLKLQWKDVGGAILSSTTFKQDYAGQLLPDSMSSYPKGFKVVSFYADPESLMVGAYVLRRDGWRDNTHLYQRILVRGKIAKMRKYLAEQERVFVNNVIVTLPADTNLNNPKKAGENLPKDDLNKARPVTVSLPVAHGTIGIIDGQHRVFCYHEGTDSFEKNIAVLRKRQHLLVTGIIYPADIEERARLEFEARLFLEINDTQTRARPALRQDIETIVRPFSGIAVARRVIADLSKKGAYAGKFQLAYFDAPKKIKTSSIVSYGLRPLVKFDGTDSLFSAWTHKDKSKLKAKEGQPSTAAASTDFEILEAYVDYCVKSLNDFFLAAKLSYGDAAWDVELPSPSVLLRPTSINGLIACLRRVIAAGGLLTVEEYKKKFAKLSSFKFESHKSSGWDALGQELFDKYFK